MTEWRVVLIGDGGIALDRSFKAATAGDAVSDAILEWFRSRPTPLADGSFQFKVRVSPLPQ